MPDRGRVLIVGGGIGGLCAAIALEQAGLDALVFEREPVLREAGAGLCLWHNAMQVAARLGLADDLHRLGAPLERQENRLADGRLLEGLSFAQLASEVGARAVTIHRADLQAALLARVDPARLRLGVRCVGFSLDGDGDGDGVVAHLADGGRERGAVLVGADGIRSVVRAQLLGDSPPRYAGYTCCRGIAPYDPAWFPVGWFVQAIGAGARFGVCHTGQNRVYWWATFNAPEGAPDPPEGRKADLLARYGAFAAPVPAIIAATDEAAILRNDIVDRPPMERWGDGPVTLLGDAAHAMTPNMAQGACQAMEDGLVLAGCLRDAADPAAGLRAYEARRVPRTSLVVEQSWLIGARGQGLLSEEEARRAMRLADREAVLRYVAA